MIHFIGIGGIGMSALARWFISQKVTVSGSDLVKSPITDALKKEGAEVKIGHKKSHVGPEIGLVIHSKAAEKGNPELVEARRRWVPTLLYSEAVGRLTRHYKTIAVAGAHGKSTTTALISLVLVKAGLDPTVIVGTNLKEFGNRNFRAGKSNWLVLEADEFGKSFLNYSPTVTIITNIESDHLDTYKNLRDIQNNFLKFLANTKRGGILVLNKDSKNLYSLKNRISKIAAGKNLNLVWFSISRHSRVFAALRRVLKIPGDHNVSNALAAYTVGKILRTPEKKILSAIASYRGAWRRMEYRGSLKAKSSKLKAKIFDDYAHHPTEIKATLKAFKEKRPKSFIICVYQPHQALRLKKLWKDFISAFTDADVLVLLPIYQVAGRERSREQGVRSKDSKKLAEAIKKKYPQKQVFYLANPKNIKRFLFRTLPTSYSSSPTPVLVMMGAGDIVNYTPLLIGIKNKE